MCFQSVPTWFIEQCAGARALARDNWSVTPFSHNYKKNTCHNNEIWIKFILILYRTKHVPNALRKIGLFGEEENPICGCFRSNQMT